MHVITKLFNACSTKYIQLLKRKISFCNHKRPFDIVEKMPRSKKDIEVLREIRVKNKKLSKSTRFPPGEIYLCVLGNGSVSSSRALYMFTDHERYLFNCGEGTQRLAQEHKTKMSKLNHIFITHNSWENTGGLPGMSLTLQDMGVPEITLHGPSNLDLLYEHSKSFAVFKSLDIRTESYKNEKFCDDCMEVHYIPIFADSHTSVIPSNLSSDSSTSSSEDSNDDDTTEPMLKRSRLSTHDRIHQDVTVAFACKGHSKPGHLLFEKCIDLGVPPGPLLGELKNGKNVTLPSGKIVLSKDVVSEEQRCPLFLVVECPSMEFLRPFVNEDKFHQYQSSSPFSSEIASVVVHFTPPDIINTPEYQQWINKFPESTCHLILNNNNATLNSTAVHRIQHKLHLLHPEIFSLLQEKEVSENHSNHQNLVQANTLERYHLRPANGLDRNAALKINIQEFIEEAMQIGGFEESLINLKNNIHKNSLSRINGDRFPVITFLGTGSSIPCKARNVSSILVNTSENKYVLLDCGEGTFGQLVRLYGKEYERILEQIFCIFISHIHADHHLGLIQILKARDAICKKKGKICIPVTIIGPKVLKVWLRSYHRSIEHLTHLYRFYQCSMLEYTELSNMEQDIFQDSTNILVSTVRVNHCPNAYGAVVTQKDSKWKLVYSGDTMPCERLVIAGKNCSVLIHEATMEDELLDEAIIKKHSTTSEAIKIGADMASDHTILTHFSQRYAKIPLFNENFHNHVGCAFDNMTVCLSELHILPLLIPTLKCLFAEDVEEMNTKGDKRRNKIKLINSMSKESLSEI